MPLVRCMWYQPDGVPINGGCRNIGGGCQFVHPSEPKWSSSAPSKRTPFGGGGHDPSIARGPRSSFGGGPSPFATSTNMDPLGSTSQWGNPSSSRKRKEPEVQQEDSAWGTVAASSGGDPWGQSSNNASWGDSEPTTRDSSDGGAWGSSVSTAADEGGGWGSLAVAEGGWGQDSAWGNVDAAQSSSGKKDGKESSAKDSGAGWGSGAAWGGSGRTDVAKDSADGWGSGSGWGTTDNTSTDATQASTRVKIAPASPARKVSDSGWGASPSAGFLDASSSRVKKARPPSIDTSVSAWAPSSPTIDYVPQSPPKDADADTPSTAAWARESPVARRSFDTHFDGATLVGSTSSRQASLTNDYARAVSETTESSSAHSSSSSPWRTYLMQISTAVRYHQELQDAEKELHRCRNLARSNEFGTYRPGTAARDKLEDLRREHDRKVSSKKRKLENAIKKLVEIHATARPDTHRDGMDEESTRKYLKEVEEFTNAVRPLVHQLQTSPSSVLPPASADAPESSHPAKRPRLSSEEDSKESQADDLNHFIAALSKQVAKIEDKADSLEDFSHSVIIRSTDFWNNVESAMQRKVDENNSLISQLASEAHASKNKLEAAKTVCIRAEKAYQDFQKMEQMLDADVAKIADLVKRTQSVLKGREQLQQENEELRARHVMYTLREEEVKKQMELSSSERAVLKAQVNLLLSTPPPTFPLADFKELILPRLQDSTRKDTKDALEEFMKGTAAQVTAQQKAIVESVWKRVAPAVKMTGAIQQFMEAEKTKMRARGLPQSSE